MVEVGLYFARSIVAANSIKNGEEIMRSICGVLMLALIAVPALAADPPHWAYPLVVEKNVAPGDEEPGPRQAPGSAKTYTQQQIDDIYNPPDWFPDAHAPAPAVVQRGSGKAVPACGSCHLMSGMGHPESSHVAGLPAAYQMRQLADFKSGARKDGARMNGIAAGMSDEEMREASEWFAALKPLAWNKVVETDTVPKTYIGKGRMRFALADAGTEPLGNRIVELPQEPRRAAIRDPNSGFVAYVPPGSIAKGAALVTTGGAGKTVACATCHGQRLEGLGDAPRIAGFSPLYVARQLIGTQTGARGGASAALMKPVVVQLNEEDIIAIAAYLATLTP
jgi:cytochrome c553